MIPRPSLHHCILPALVILAGCRRPAPLPPPTVAVTPPVLVVDAGTPLVDVPAVAAAPPGLPPVGGVVPSSPVTQIALGHNRACAVRVDGRVVCWGVGFEDNEANRANAAPALVVGLVDAVEIAGDLAHWCARRRSGEVRCWDETLRTGPIETTDAAELAWDCVRMTNGSVWCWEGGAVGPPTLREVALPGPVRALGHGTIPCAVHVDGSVSCWGAAGFHQLPGDAGVSESNVPPVRLPGLAGVDEVGTSQFAPSCARVGSRVWCWGGEGSASYHPVPLRGVTNALRLAVGEYHSCALTSGGRVSCWGANASGQLARTREALGESATPVVVRDVTGAVEVVVGGGEPAGGGGSTCVRDAAGGVRCWGQINGESRPTAVDLSSAQEPAPR